MSALARIDAVCDGFERDWRAGHGPRIEDCLAGYDGNERAVLVRELVKLEVELRKESRKPVTPAEYIRRIPGYPEAIVAVFEQAGCRDPHSNAEPAERPDNVEFSYGPPAAAPANEGAGHGESLSGSTVPEREVELPIDDGAPPGNIGGYRIECLLGQGSFGCVYLAWDELLERQVAVKVPHRHRIRCIEDVQAYLAEAQTLAKLDEHPNIVTVYYAGSAEGFPFFVVSKYIQGTTLAKRIQQGPMTPSEAAALVASVAEALHFAHLKGIVHRDVKPSNILLDTKGKAYVADFGMALREEEYGRGPGFAGTPAYMSPEQARSEGHRVDGRSDEFSLGVVFYELLTRRRPFRGETQDELLDQIARDEPRPPRQIDDAVPAELERICLKALSKHAAQRYPTLRDMAEDLRCFLQASRPATAVPAPEPEPPAPEPPPIQVVPKGLRSFDAGDTEFFLELLPGPRDRNGMPEGLRFWKSLVEETDADRTFTVGLLYGPSGCGKSSFIKAGLLPRLAGHVDTVYVEASVGETEARLLKALRKIFPALAAENDLAKAVAALRRGVGRVKGKKVLIVLDQFEQWLHTRQGEEDSELVRALRQCDGGRVQCLTLIRDDFWMAATRLLQQLEVRLLEGENSAAVDLFDVRHARKVLGLFGRAFGAIPGRAELGPEQTRFLEQAVAGLTVNGQVVPVRLAVFAEMVKGSEWVPATLKAVGGPEGVGQAFLEQAFGPSAAPGRRIHQKAARKVLKTLLPEQGTDIRGALRARAELLEASEYASQPGQFEDLLRILDRELRLVSPSDPEGTDSESSRGRDGRGRHYQLTHDYLVPSIRGWLNRKQKESMRGRAELRLEELAELWNARPENRLLPSFWQWGSLLILTRKTQWSPPERDMMRRAARYHGKRMLGLLFMLVAFGLGACIVQGRMAEQSNIRQAASLVQRLVDADTVQVPGIVDQMSGYRPWVEPLLEQESRNPTASPRHKLNASLALLPTDRAQVDYLFSRLLEAEPREVPVIRDALSAHREVLLDRLWAVVEEPKKVKEGQRLRAAAALASFDSGSPTWATTGDRVANDLLGVPAVHLSSWMELLRPVKTKLLPELSAAYRDRHRRETERSVATDILADYAANEPRRLADLLMDADARQFAVIYPKLADHWTQGVPALTAELDRKCPPGAAGEVKEELTGRQANAAVALLKVNEPAKLWPLLRHGPDPSVRTCVIHRLGPLGADVSTLVKQLDVESDVTIRRALILSLGPDEFPDETWSPGEKTAMVQRLQEMYRTSADPGIHAAAEWLLREWHSEEWLQQINKDWAHDKEERGRRLARIMEESTKDTSTRSPQWYVNGQAQTLVVIPQRMEFVMGSPETEADRGSEEIPHRVRIERSFAIADKPVTIAQYRRFDPRYGVGEIEKWAHFLECPVIGTNWFQAAAYCNWLSEQEGLPPDQWCYEPLQDPMKRPELAGSSIGMLAGSLAPLSAACGVFPGRTDPQFKAGMKLARNYLQRTGYRLATEAEIEFATRAGSGTSRYFGESESFLDKYAWYKKNSQEEAHPVGTKRPNDLGFFDLLGNVLTWCDEKYTDYPQTRELSVDDGHDDSLTVNIADARVLRGTSCHGGAAGTRCAHRRRNVPGTRADDVGFRVARTVVP
jgi:serine/threonine protein kinase/formylglycine-generating enzyme required for sulfatase activity